MMGLWVTTRLFPKKGIREEGIRRIIVSFLGKNVTYVNIEGIGLDDFIFRAVLNGFFFHHPNAAFYEGRRYELSQQHLFRGNDMAEDPYVAPTVFPTDPRKVTYEHDMYARLGLDSVVFKGQSIHLHRGDGDDSWGARGPNVISNRGVDECILALPAVSNWL
ncbi:MAG: hypothetical protein QGG01_00690, partial [Roseibacillus sp.]|nr:hypothetical protein [Roseibacillus sp.]